MISSAAISSVIGSRLSTWTWVCTDGYTGHEKGTVLITVPFICGLRKPYLLVSHLGLEPRTY